MNFESYPQQRDTYRFNELTSITGVKPYVLRFWESEFDQINPNTTDKGEKSYSQSDLDSIKEIKKLLFEDKLSISEARCEFNGQLEQERITAIELSSIAKNIATNIHSGVTVHTSSFNIMKNALANDMQAVQACSATSEILQVRRQSFNDKDIINLVQAKRKLSNILTKLDKIIESKWKSD